MRILTPWVGPHPQVPPQGGLRAKRPKGPKGPKGPSGSLGQGALRAPWAQGALRAPWEGRLRRPWGPLGRWIDFEIIPNGYLQRDTHPCIVEVGPKRIHFLSFHSQLRSSPGHLKGGVRDPWLKLNI